MLCEPDKLVCVIAYVLCYMSLETTLQFPPCRYRPVPLNFPVSRCVVPKLPIKEVNFLKKLLMISDLSSAGTTTSSHDLNKFNINLWQFPKLVSSWTEEGVVNSTSFHIHTPPGNMFLAVGLQGGKVKIFNLPSFKIASELHFPEMKGSECSHITINHSRETPIMSSVYYRNPFRDLILTTVWSDGRIMVCQVAKQVTV